jgi:radical SAM protein (TIGR01212 family)
MNHDHGNHQPGWYYRLSRFFKLKFGEAVYKIPIDAGFSCPNRDGTVGMGGCSYCYNPSFSPFSSEKPISLREQLLKGKKKNKKALYLAYFQAYTNTYAPVEELRALYGEALADDEVVGLSIATRPDCISAEILNTLESYAKRCHLWVEYGLQSAHDVTLKQINRGHDAACFARAVEQTKNRGIFICAHIILGLPGESRDMMLQTIDYINRCGVDGVKFHHLQVIKSTALFDQYQNGDFAVYKKAEDFIPTLCDCLEKLDPQIVIHRLASQAASEDLLIAPHWPEGAGQIATMVETELLKRGTHQGFLYQT